MFVQLSEEIQGYILDCDVFNDRGMLLLPKGHLLVKSDIQFLLKNHIFEVEATAPQAENEENPSPDSPNEDSQPSSPDLPPSSTYQLRILDAHNHFAKAVEDMEGLFNKTQKECRIDTEEFSSIFHPLVDISLQQRNLFLSLSLSPSEQQRLYHHSLQVGIISTVMAKLLKLPEDQCRRIGMAGLIHDIGKVLLEDPSEYKKHPTHGYHLLLNSKNATQEMLDAVQFHHESPNGKGYPNGKMKEEIPLAAQIIAAANLFEHMSHDQHSSTHPSPYMALSGLVESAYNGEIDLEIVTPFVSFLTPSFIGQKVVLTGELIGEIVSIDNDEPNRPTVRLSTGQFMNLKVHRYFKIQRVLEKSPTIV